MTHKTPKPKRSNLEQYFRDSAAESWVRSRYWGKDIYSGHFGGKFIAYRLAAEKVAIDQEINEINETVNLVKHEQTDKSI